MRSAAKAPARLGPGRPRESDVSPAQQRVLDALVFLTKDLGCAPSIEELAIHLEISANAVHDHLKRLRDKERVTWEPGKPRTLRVCPPAGRGRRSQ